MSTGDYFVNLNFLKKIISHLKASRNFHQKTTFLYYLTSHKEGALKQANILPFNTTHILV